MESEPRSFCPQSPHSCCSLGVGSPGGFLLQFIELRICSAKPPACDGMRAQERKTQFPGLQTIF